MMRAQENLIHNKKRTDVPQDYKPSETEKYMNPLQLEYFRQKLVGWKNELLTESRQTIEHLSEENWQETDLNDRASLETDTTLELRTRDRYRKLLDKIDGALEKVDSGEYGYCEETGDEIGIRRLEARPIAALTVEAQERHENYERLHSEDDD